MDDAALLEQLLFDHREIRKALETLAELRISSSEGKEFLWGLKKLLLTHLALEDKELYPRLAAREGAIAETFQSEMAEISDRVLRFFASYEEGIGNSMQFARDFGQMQVMLLRRMIREEMRLYPAFLDRRTSVTENPRQRRRTDF